MRNVLDALDALGLALANHNHCWSDRERQLYELAVGEVTSSSRTVTGSLARAKYSRPRLSRTPSPQSAPLETDDAGWRVAASQLFELFHVGGGPRLAVVLGSFHIAFLTRLASVGLTVSANKLIPIP